MRSHVPRDLQSCTPGLSVGAKRSWSKAFGIGLLGLSAMVMASLLMLRSSVAKAQTAPQPNAAGGNAQTVGTMSDVMVSMVYPAANGILLSVYRGGPQDDKEWVAIQRNAVLLAESGSVLMTRGPNAGEWAKDAKTLVDVGAAAYKAAQAKDQNALAAVDQPLNAACTSCHKQYRPYVAGPQQRQGPSHQPSE
jgi:hypothetical protein